MYDYKFFHFIDQYRINKMRRYFIFAIIVVSIASQDSQIKLPVKPQTHQKLSLSLQKLVDQLQFFRTPYQNKTNLYKRVALTEQYLQEVSDQVSQYNNVILGQHNMVDGDKNVIVGSYNTITGSNNFVFIEKYTGQANGDLLIGKWRIQIQKKRLILISSSLAISYINQEENRKYLRFLNQKRGFNYGSSLGENTYTVLKQVDQAAQTDLYSYGQSSQIRYTQNSNLNYGSSIQNGGQIPAPSSFQQTQQTIKTQNKFSSSVSETYTTSSSSKNNEYSAPTTQNPNQNQYQSNSYLSSSLSNSNNNPVSESSVGIGYLSAKISSDSISTSPLPNNYASGLSSRSSSIHQTSNNSPGISSSQSGYQNNRFNTLSSNLGNVLGLNSGISSTSIRNNPSNSFSGGNSQTNYLRTQNINTPPSTNSYTVNPQNNLSARYLRFGATTPSYFPNSQNNNGNGFGGVLTHQVLPNLVNSVNSRSYS